MQAIEFITKAKNGIIEIPKEHLKNLSDEFRVIILLEPGIPEQKRKSKKKQLSSLSVKTKGLTFGRDEANER